MTIGSRMEVEHVAAECHRKGDDWSGVGIAEMDVAPFDNLQELIHQLLIDSAIDAAPVWGYQEELPGFTAPHSWK